MLYLIIARILQYVSYFLFLLSFAIDNSFFRIALVTLIVLTLFELLARKFLFKGVKPIIPRPKIEISVQLFFIASTVLIYAVYHQSLSIYFLIIFTFFPLIVIKNCLKTSTVEAKV